MQIVLTDAGSPAFKVGNEVNSGRVCLGDSTALNTSGGKEGSGSRLCGDFDHFGSLELRIRVSRCY